jgi:ASC-1-like (ASCH) protein
MPLFMVKKEIFEWIRSGRKTVELRKGKAKSGDQAVFQCGRNILRGKITRKYQNNLEAILQIMDFKKILPIANSAEDVKERMKQFYGTTDGIFTAYQFTLS